MVDSTIHNRLDDLVERMKPKHIAVCNLLLAGKSQADAWKAVYSRVRSEKTASQNCSENLKKPETGMAEYVVLMKHLAVASAARKLEIDQFYVLAGLKENVDRSMQIKHVFRFADGELETREPGEPDIGDATYQGAFSYNASGAIRALELIGKHLGMFKGGSERPEAAREEFGFLDALGVLNSNEGL